MLSPLIRAVALSTTLVVTHTYAKCGDDLPNGIVAGESSTVHHLQSSGGDRSYLLHIPSSYDKHRPTSLIFSYHAGGKNASQQESLSQFSNETYNHDAIAVYPQGKSQTWQGAPQADASVDDVQFTLDMITSLSSNFCLDQSRIYASGKSDGGEFVRMLACDPHASVAIAAFAPVSGAFYQTGVDSNVTIDGPCQPGRTPIPMLEFHGSADPVVPYEGDRRMGEFLPAIPTWLQGWAGVDGCAGEAGSNTMLDGGVVNKTTWSCAGQTDIVTGYWIEGLKHVWPSTTPNDDDPTGHTVLNATPIILAFFGNYSLSM